MGDWFICGYRGRWSEYWLVVPDCKLTALIMIYWMDAINRVQYVNHNLRIMQYVIELLMSNRLPGRLCCMARWGTVRLSHRTYCTDEQLAWFHGISLQQGFEPPHRPRFSQSTKLFTTNPHCIKLRHFISSKPTSIDRISNSMHSCVLYVFNSGNNCTNHSCGIYESHIRDFSTFSNLPFLLYFKSTGITYHVVHKNCDVDVCQEWKLIHLFFWENITTSYF